jgi:PAS domain S-box-containing protein
MREKLREFLAPSPAEEAAALVEARHTLELAAERRRAIAEAAASILWSADPNGKVLDMAPQWYSFTGQTPKQYRGGGWLDVVHPDDRRLAAETWAAALRDKKPGDAVYRLRHVSGDYRFTAVRYVPVFDRKGRLREWVGWMADIDTQVRAERERDRFFTLSLDLLCIVGMDSVFKRVNPAFERMLGFTIEELCSSSSLDFVHPENRVSTLAQFEKLKAGMPTVYFENRFRCKDGSYRWLAWSAFPEIEDGLIYAAARDITERKVAEAQVKEQAAKLAEADRRKDEFLAMLAHELRNPLSPIRAAVEVLRRATSPEQLTWSIDIIDRQVVHLTRLIDDLLDVARITRGRITLKKTVFDLCTVVDDAIDAVRPLIDRRRHRLRVSLPDDPITIEADSVRVEQVLVNLLDNAAKYTDDGGDITLEAEVKGDHLVIRVRDNGIGMEPQTASAMFDIFTQASRSLERAQGGLGLGLALVKRLTEMHGGSVVAESRGIGQGSTFTVILPLLTTIPATTPQTSAPLVGDIGRLRVLVVDDDPDVADGMSMFLETLGHDVQIAPDGPAALAIARAFQPEVGLLDIGLPGMDGYELARELRTHATDDKLMLIAITGYGDEDTRQRVKHAGFDHHLLKPCGSEELEQLLTLTQRSRV